MHNHRINDPELDHVLACLIDQLQLALNDNLVGVYINGSIALDDWDDASDVDFMVVIKDELDQAQLAALQAMHAAIYRLPSPWAQKLAGSYVSEALIRYADPSKTPLWYLANGSSGLVLSTHDNELIVWWMVREYGIPLVGPEASSLIEPIDQAALCQEIRNTMHDWAGELQDGKYQINNQWEQAFTVVSYCRMLHSLATGRINLISAGVDWALVNVEPQWHQLIQQTWENRPNPSLKYLMGAEPTLVTETLDFVKACLQRSPR